MFIDSVMFLNVMLHYCRAKIAKASMREKAQLKGISLHSPLDTVKIEVKKDLAKQEEYCVRLLKQKSAFGKKDHLFTFQKKMLQFLFLCYLAMSSLSIISCNALWFCIYSKLNIRSISINCTKCWESYLSQGHNTYHSGWVGRFLLHSWIRDC